MYRNVNHATQIGDSHMNEKNVALKHCNFPLQDLAESRVADPTVEDGDER